MARKPLGVLLIHGFPGNNHDFETLEPALKQMNLPYRIPTLRGMGQASPDSLRGVTWRDWLADARAALDDLLGEANRVVLLGHSMGGAIAVELAAQAGAVIDSVVLAAAAIQLRSPFAPGQPLNFAVPGMKLLFKQWKFPPSPIDGYRRGYPWAPVEAVLSLLELTREVRGCLPAIKAPVLLVQGKQDDMIAKESILITLEGLGTPKDEKRAIWFDDSGHDIFFDAHSGPVIAAVVGFISERAKIATGWTG